MRIDQITLKNFKGFEEKPIEFKSQFNVIIGNNATGKTSILDALSIAVGSFFLGIDGTDSRHISKDEIRLIWKHDDPRPQLPVEILCKGSVNKKELTWKRRLLKDGGRTTRKGAEAVEKIASQMHKSYRSGKDPVFPIICYHGTGRLWAEHQEKIDYRKQTEGVLMGYKDCLSSKSSSKAFLAWYKTFSQDTTNFGGDVQQGLLDAFHEAITKIIPEWSRMQYHYSLDQLIGFYKDENGKEEHIGFHHLSDGYKNMIGMVADIIYRCIKLNPHLGDKVVEETPGLVLIDELDLHLHPKWQREIVERLKTTFPNIQFVVTTHSPFIVQSLKSDELINLDEQALAAQPYTRSLEENAMFMGAESQRSTKFESKVGDAHLFEETVNRMARDKKQSLSEFDAVDLETLESILERNSDDPALVARLKIKRLSKLGSDETS